MKLLEWDPTYSVGVEEVDAQHRWLVEIINVLYEGLQEERSIAVVDTVLESLIQYTRAHFATEEQLMRNFGYPGLADHSARHAELGAKVAGWQRDYRKDATALTSDMLLFLKDWLQTHELEVDKPMGAFLCRCGVGYGASTA